MDSTSPILIAEDNDDDALLLKRTLSKIGVENPVHIVRDGEEAIAYLKAEGQYADRTKFPFPRFLVTDLKMPKVGGLELLQFAREHPDCAVVPIIVFTSSQHESDVSKAYKLGANCYVVKPQTLEEWDGVLKATFDFWCRFAQKPPLPLKCA
jgi:CheY-like chemotaxis protein